ncbi:hypothetical protein [Phytohabitans suffuscus]
MNAVNAGVIYHYYWYGDRADDGADSKNTELVYFGGQDPGAGPQHPVRDHAFRYLSGRSGEHVIGSTAREPSPRPRRLGPNLCLTQGGYWRVSPPSWPAPGSGRRGGRAASRDGGCWVSALFWCREMGRFTFAELVLPGGCRPLPAGLMYDTCDEARGHLSGCARTVAVFAG